MSEVSASTQYWRQQQQQQKGEQNMSKSMGAADWAQTGIGAANTAVGLGLGIWQAVEAKKAAQAQEKQRQIENERYNQQKAYHEKGINDAANTASGLKSASANVSSQKPQQNAPQTPNNPPQPAQEAQAQTPPQEDLPMQRQ